MAYNVSEDYHILLAGATRRGKTTLEKMLLNVIELKNKYLDDADKVRIIVGDPKGDWTEEIEQGATQVYQYQDSFKAIDLAYLEFKKRLKSKEKNYPYLILIFDELNSSLESIDDTKRLKDIQKKLKLLIYQSASLKIRLFMIFQSLYGSIVGGASFKHQFDVKIALTISEEVNYDLFNWSDEKIDKNLPKGYAIYQRAGERPQVCKVKKVTDEVMTEIIRNLANFASRELA